MKRYFKVVLQKKLNLAHKSSKLIFLFDQLHNNAILMSFLLSVMPH